jgi:hypothetical protein
MMDVGDPFPNHLNNKPYYMRQLLIIAIMILANNIKAQFPPAQGTSRELKPPKGGIYREDTIPVYPSTNLSLSLDTTTLIRWESFIVADDNKILMMVTDSTFEVFGDTIDVLIAIIKSYGIRVPNLPKTLPIIPNHTKVLIYFDGRNAVQWPADAPIPRKGESITNEDKKNGDGRFLKGEVIDVRYFIKNGEVEVRVSVSDPSPNR